MTRGAFARWIIFQVKGQRRISTLCSINASFYGGCEDVDIFETIVIDRAKIQSIGCFGMEGYW